MTDRDRRNGPPPLPDLEVLPVPDEMRRLSRIKAEQIEADDADFDLKRKLSDALLQVVPSMNLLVEYVDRSNRHLISLIKAWNTHVEFHREERKYKEETPALPTTMAVPPPPPMPRERESSYSELDPDLTEFRRILREGMKNPNNRFDSVRAKALIQASIQSARIESKAAAWDGIWVTVKKALPAVLAAIITAVLLMLWTWLKNH
jgi:hypothetical protein